MERRIVVKNKDLGFRQFLPLLIVGGLGLVVWVIFSEPFKGPPLFLCPPLFVALVVATIAGIFLAPKRRHR